MTNEIDPFSVSKEDGARAFDPLLSILRDFDGEILGDVRQIVDDGMFVALALQFGTKFLKITAIAVDDSISLSLERGHAEGNPLKNEDPWLQMIGKRLGWGWLAINQQGYTDGVMLAFDEVVVPEIVIAVVASELKVRRCSRLERSSGSPLFPQ